MIIFRKSWSETIIESLIFFEIGVILHLLNEDVALNNDACDVLHVKTL